MRKEPREPRNYDQEVDPTPKKGKVKSQKQDLVDRDIKFDKGKGLKGKKENEFVDDEPAQK